VGPFSNLELSRTTSGLSALAAAKIAASLGSASITRKILSRATAAASNWLFIRVRSATRTRIGVELSGEAIRVPHSRMLMSAYCHPDTFAALVWTKLTGVFPALTSGGFVEAQLLLDPVSHGNTTLAC
jgi:hypothetical protein